MVTAVSRPDHPSRRPAVAIGLIWIAVVLCLFAAARLLSPGPGQTLVVGGVELPQLCWLRALVAVDCPGCGLTRSFVLAVRLRLTEAWAMHPIGVLLALYLAATIPQRLWRLARLLTSAPTQSTLRWEMLFVVMLVVVAYARWLALGLW